MSGADVNVVAAAAALSSAQALLVGAGAGMGADAGLETYRTREEFWQFYPQLRALDRNIPEMSNFRLFLDDPALAWGFYGTRHKLYKETPPHEGYTILKKWADQMTGGYFIFTSNVDGHFSRSGFDPSRVLERHGSINLLQCTDLTVGEEVWPAPPDLDLNIDPVTLRASGNFPRGPPGYATEKQCLARPNLVFFRDETWVTSEVDRQEGELLEFLRKVKAKNLNFVVVEIGAGATIQTVRGLSEYMVQDCTDGKGTLIRINPTEPEVPEGQGHIAIRMKGMEALKLLHKELENMQIRST